MKKRRSSKRRNNMRFILAASVLCLVLCDILLAANFTLPTYAWYSRNASSASQTTQSATYSIQAESVTENGESLENSEIVGIADGDNHYYRLTAEGTASTGYAKVDVTSGNNTSTYYVSPIAKGETVNLTVQAATGSQITITGSWGTPPEDENTVAVVTASLSMEEASTLQASLEVSQTPSVEYTVPERATLESIAGHYGVSPEDILIYNGIDAIQPGDVIRIPNPATLVPYEPAQIYTVQKGDTLQSIAECFGVTIKSLCQWNDIDMDMMLYPGMRLTIPVLYTPPAETEPVETQPVETEPVETQPAETEPAETEPAEEEDETVYVLGVPQYFQSDYPDTLYADGTVKTSGCSVTCLTMVANAVTGYDYAVDELADYFGGRAINNMERLEIGSETLGLSFYKSENWDRTWEALQDGKIVIALMDGLEGPCLFTNSQHFIVLTGLNEDGKIMVNDPNPANYELWNLKNAFQNGFTANDILLGYSGAWVYDRTLEETPERYSEPRLIKSEEKKNYPEITLTQEERELLARVIWVEAQGECAEGQQAVAEVVFNRMLSDQFGDTLNDVIYGEGQFRSVPYLEDAKPTQAQYQAIDRAMYGTPVLNKNVLYFATYPTNTNIFVQIGNHIFCYG